MIAPGPLGTAVLTLATWALLLLLSFPLHRWRQRHPGPRSRRAVVPLLTPAESAAALLPYDRAVTVEATSPGYCEIAPGESPR